MVSHLSVLGTGWFDQVAEILYDQNVFYNYVSSNRKCTNCTAIIVF